MVYGHSLVSNRTAISIAIFIRCYFSLIGNKLSIIMGIINRNGNLYVCAKERFEPRFQEVPW